MTGVQTCALPIFSFDVIAATVRGPAHYLGAPQTLSLMQSEYLYPAMGDRTSLSEWEHRGAPQLMERARVRVAEIMARHYPSYLDEATDARVRGRFDIRLARELMQPGNTRWPATAGAAV